MSSLKLERPIADFNVIHEFVKDKGGNYKLIELMGRAMGIDTTAASAPISFIQTQKNTVDVTATVKIGFKGVTVYPRQVAYIKCRVPERFNYWVACSIWAYAR